MVWIMQGELVLPRNTEFRKEHHKMQDKTAKRKCNCFVVERGNLPPGLFHLDFQLLPAVVQTDGLV